ncbi:MAG: tRNA lysidine(34) synthetase TilS [Paracoccus sp. (in: a-proteobacteria)]
MPTDQTGPQARAFAALDCLAGDLPALGIALSGGGDSVALMHLIARWAGTRRIAVASVDHGLRPESAHEAEQAGQAAAALGLEHRILRWQGGAGGGGNLMARARAARLRLLADWARTEGLAAVMLGHTRDDVAETLLMRLARGAGLDGLSAMATRREAEGMIWLRPLLETGREELRGWLRIIGASWIEDPSNEDPRFERARMRRAMSELGLDPALLALSAENLREAREALNDLLAPILDDSRVRAGSVLLPRQAFDAASQESRRRLVLAAVRFVTGAHYPPRRAGVDHALSALAEGRRVSLDGAVLDPGAEILIHREAGRVEAGMQDDIWDNRWRITGLQPGDRVAALGADAAAVDWRAAGLGHLEAQALPAVRRADRLLVPALTPAEGLGATPLRNMTDFRRILFGH